MHEALECAKGSIKLTFLLNRSGKISDIKTEGTTDCKTTNAGLKALRKLNLPLLIKTASKFPNGTFEIKREERTSLGNP